MAPFDRLNVNWASTNVWSEGGYYARVFFNVQGREPQGVIPPAGYEAFPGEMKARLAGLPRCLWTGLAGQSLKPQNATLEQKQWLKTHTRTEPAPPRAGKLRQRLR